MFSNGDALDNSVISATHPTTLTTSGCFKSWFSRALRLTIGATAVSDCITKRPSAHHVVHIPWNKAAADDFIEAGMALVAHVDSNDIRMGELTK